MTTGFGSRASRWVACALAAAALASFALFSMTFSAAAQGIGLPGQNDNLPLEINAEDGIEWQQGSKAYVARGNARAKQGDVTVFADVLTAYYRDRPNGGTQIWRIDGTGNVRIASTTQTAHGDKAVYDVDRGVLVLTGNVRLVTETDRITARDSLEYWEKRNLAVARGNAIAVRGENRLRADILTARFAEDTNGKVALDQIDAFDNVVISSATEIVRAARGVYDVQSGIARLTGSVKITRGQNQLNGAYAEVDLNSGVSRLFGGGQQGVRGYFVPNEIERNGNRPTSGGAATPGGGSR